jgi:predicted transcriptional regulator YheO
MSTPAGSKKLDIKKYALKSEPSANKPGVSKRVLSSSAKLGPTLSERALLLREGKKIVEALGRTLAPFCEVVLHDLSKPSESIVAIENPISGRKLGDAGTELSLERAKNPSFPDAITNYENTLFDGRPVKSTAIGIRNSEGSYVASICLNIDIGLFDSVQRILAQFVATETDAMSRQETLRSRSVDQIREIVLDFAAMCGTTPQALSLDKRKELVQHLASGGYLELRGAPGKLSELLGVARSSIYNLMK